MRDQELVNALRCVSTAGGPMGDCKKCPFYKTEPVPKDLARKVNLTEWSSCDVDAVGLAAADRIEAQAKEIEKLRAQNGQLMSIIADVTKDGKTWMCQYCAHCKGIVSGMADCDSKKPCIMPYSQFELKRPEPPEEVSALVKDWSDLCTIVGECGGLDRVRALAEADRDGRLVVLPCKDWLEVVFGDQVLFWGIDKDYVEQPIMEISLDDADRIGWYDGYKTVFLKGTDENGEAWEFYPEEIGETVFLTREEAEAALEAMKDD